MAGFLSDEWFDHLARLAADVAVPEGPSLVVQQVVVDGSDEVAYALRIAGGRLSVHRGAVEEADVTIRQDRSTAEAIHHGRLAAQAAFLDGRLRLAGDVTALIRAAPTLADLDDVFAQARA